MAIPVIHGPDAVRVPKAAELVAGHIRKRIVRGELDEGDALRPETALMEQFGVSRPTLREAFRILESEGLIVVRRGARGGARVQIPSSDVAARYTGLVLQHRGATLDDVLAARVFVEAPAAALLAGRRDRVRVANRLRQWLDDFESGDKAGSPAYTAAFHGFNRLLVQLTENETLILLTSMLESISDAASAGYVRISHPDDDRMARRAARTRYKLIELIGAGDSVGAEELFQRHLTEAGSILAGDRGERVVDVLD